MKSIKGRHKIKPRHRKWPTTKAKRFYMIDARKLKALMHLRPDNGIRILGDEGHPNPWFCQACGGRAKQYFGIKHADDCSFIAAQTARGLLAFALEGAAK